MKPNATEVFYPRTPAAWRRWLERHHRSKESVWLVSYTKASGKPSVSWSDAVDAALCFGWIDSKKIAIDEERSQQFFSRRKPKSTWSKINKDKVERLTAAGLMQEAGYEAIAVAKANGSWSLLDSVEALEVPGDLEAALGARPGAAPYFHGLSRTARKGMLQWLVLARRPETRQQRIDAIADAAAAGTKPKGF